MSTASKILYEHLKDYPLSTEGYHAVGMRAVSAALCCEHMPEPADPHEEKHAREPRWIDRAA